MKWRRSSRCDSASCVEVMDLGTTVIVRDSGSGRQIEVTRREWQAFVEGVKLGDFDFGD
ncbi:MAG TPA: DUF397 domain-containing protein [Micromonosporaceae bacterium]|nr:DUF397 domain-containing protein [Micromonosporaceae bacterium]